MRLIRKTSRAYFLISLVSFLIAGVVIYFALSLIFRNTLEENLLSDIEKLKLSIENHEKLPSYSPYIDVFESPEMELQGPRVSDTLIFDPFENEKITYRQVSIVTLVDGKKYFIAARDTLLEKSDMSITIAIVTGSVLILLLICLYFVNRRLSLKIWQPFYQILDKLKDFSYSKPEFSLSLASNTDEFNELNNVLDSLTQKVISDYHSLSRFSEDASHEIQTPLAVIQSKLESLMQYSDLQKEKYELISSAYASTLRVSRLAQTLLLLTKISNKQFPEKQSIHFSNLVEEKISFFTEMIAKKKLLVRKNICEDIFIDTNPFLAESLVMNLLSNAFKYTASPATIDVSLDNKQFSVKNPGPPLSVPSSKLFVRFFKSDKSSESYGLGLSIVEEICAVSGWKIRYNYENRSHKFFVLF